MHHRSVLVVVSLICALALPWSTLSAEEAPNAEFLWTADGLTVFFEDLSTGGPRTWTWDLGDGTIRSLQNPFNTYASAGGYFVTLTVSNHVGQSSITKRVVVTEDGGLPPSADFSWQVSGLTASFTNLTIGRVLQYAWDFGDGSTSSEAEPVRTFAEEGTYGVELTASNSYGYSVKTATVTVGDSDTPEADFSWTSEGLTVSFRDRSAGQPTTWRWDFGDGNSSTSRSPVYTYSRAGVYDVGLEVANDAGTSAVTDQVSAEGQAGVPPLADFRWSTDGLEVEFDNRTVQQINRIFDAYSPVEGYVDVWSETPEALFFCFGSVIDNLSGDPTTILTK